MRQQIWPGPSVGRMPSARPRRQPADGPLLQGATKASHFRLQLRLSENAEITLGGR